MVSRLTLLALLAFGALPSSAQGGIRDIVSAVEAGIEACRFDTVGTPHAERLIQEIAFLNTRFALSEPGPSALARWDQQQYLNRSLPDSDSITSSLDVIRQVANNQLADSLDSAIGKEGRREILQPLTDFHADLLHASLQQSLERIRKYEVKFGPNSARLNLLEVMLNMLLQSAPGFGPNENGDPGSFEVLAGYTTTYFTLDDGDVGLVAAGEIGLRRYMFGRGWGKRGFIGYIKPNHVSAGLYMGSTETGPLAWPWRDSPNYGAFMGWGGLKVAYTLEEENRLLISREFHVVPWLF